MKRLYRCDVVIMVTPPGSTIHQFLRPSSSASARPLLPNRRPDVLDHQVVEGRRWRLPVGTARKRRHHVELRHGDDPLVTPPRGRHGTHRPREIVRRKLTLAEVKPPLVKGTLVLGLGDVTVAERNFTIVEEAPAGARRSRTSPR